MIVDPVTISPEITVAEALEIMLKYSVSGLPVTRGTLLVGILTNRDLRFESNLAQPVSEIMTKEDLVTVPVGTTLEEAEKNPAETPHRKTSGRGQRISSEGPDHRKGHPEKTRVSPRHEGRPGPAARGRRHRRHRRFPGTRCRAGDAQKWTCWRSIRPTATPTRVMEAIRAVKKRLPEMQLIAGNVATFEGARDLIALGIDGLKVGIGPGIDLHHARGDRRGRAANHRDDGSGARGKRNGRAGDRRRRHQIFRRHIESNCRRRFRGDDRRPAGGHRRIARRNDPLSGAHV